jgi:hypothetical protein
MNFYVEEKKIKIKKVLLEEMSFCSEKLEEKNTLPLDPIKISLKKPSHNQQANLHHFKKTLEQCCPTKAGLILMKLN